MRATRSSLFAYDGDARNKSGESRFGAAARSRRGDAIASTDSGGLLHLSLPSPSSSFTHSLSLSILSRLLFPPPPPSPFPPLRARARVYECVRVRVRACVLAVKRVSACVRARERGGSHRRETGGGSPTACQVTTRATVPTALNLLIERRVCLQVKRAPLYFDFW